MGYREIILGDKPQGYWRLSEAFDSVTNPNNASFDQTGNNYNVLFSGGGFARQQPGALTNDPDTSATLNGTTSYLTGSGAIPNNTGPFSFECWAKITKAISTTGQYLVNDQNSTKGRYLYVRDLGVIMGFYDPTLGYGNSATAPVPSLNVWHHLVGTFDGQATRVFVDNVQGTPSPTIQPQTVNASDVALQLGKFGGGSSNFYGGGLDEVAVYPYALDPSRINKHYQAGKGIFQTGLLAML